MPVTVSAPRITSKELPREILAADFKSVGELPIHGGWGYSREDAVIIDRNDPVVPQGLPFDRVGLEYVFVEKRIYEELIIFRPENDRHSGIRWNLLRQEMKDLGSRQYDILTFEVTALRDDDWEELKAEWEGPHGYGSPGFDEGAHVQKRNARTVRYVTEYWFDITSFFGRHGPSAEQSPTRQHESPTQEQYEACAQFAHEFNEIGGMGLLAELLPQERDSAHACQMGIWYWSLGHRQLAVMAYRRSIELGESAAAYFNLAVCHDDLEQSDQALEAMRRFYELVPNESERTQAEAVLPQHGKTHLIRPTPHSESAANAPTRVRMISQMQAQNAELVDPEAGVFAVLGLAAVRLAGPYWWHSEDIDEPTARGAIFRAYEPEEAERGGLDAASITIADVTDDGTEPDVSGLEQADIAALDKYLQSEISTQFAIEGSELIRVCRAATGSRVSDDGHARQSQESQGRDHRSLRYREERRTRFADLQHDAQHSAVQVACRPDGQYQYRSSPGLQLLTHSNVQRRSRMKTLKRYKIELFFGQEVGINCAHVEVSTKTKKLGNGPIATDTKGFSVLTAKTKRAVRRALGVWGGADALVSAVCDDQVPGIEEVDVRMVMAGCKTDRPYLYVSASEEFWSEQDLVSFAKEGELLED